MLKIGLTGGIGSGKSVVAELFRRKGIRVLDADEIAHALVEPGQKGLLQIVEHFGRNILDSRGQLNRSALREIVFNSPEKRKALEAILHPLVYRRIEMEIDRIDGPYCIVCVPLLIETGRQDLFDRILVIDCPVALQIERVRARNGLDECQIRRILDSQVGRDERLAAAHDVINNDSDLTSLDNEVEKLHNFYFDLSSRSG